MNEYLINHARVTRCAATSVHPFLQPPSLPRRRLEAALGRSVGVEAKQARRGEASAVVGPALRPTS